MEAAHWSLKVSFDNIPNIAHKEATILIRPVGLFSLLIHFKSQPFSKAMKKLGPAVGVPPAHLRLKSWDGM